MKSWKTTVIGILLLAGAIALFFIKREIEGGIVITIALGFLSAKDANVTGVGDDAKTLKEIKKEEGSS